MQELGSARLYRNMSFGIVTETRPDPKDLAQGVEKILQCSLFVSAVVLQLGQYPPLRLEQAAQIQQLLMPKVSGLDVHLTDGYCFVVNNDEPSKIQLHKFRGCTALQFATPGYVPYEPIRKGTYEFSFYKLFAEGLQALNKAPF